MKSHPKALALSQPPPPSSTAPAPIAHLWRWTGFTDKTLWDWLQLLAALAIPLALGLATYGFNAQQATLAQNQHAADVQGAQDQQRDAALQSYLDRMSDLLVGNNTGAPALGTTPENDRSKQIAQIARPYPDSPSHFGWKTQRRCTPILVRCQAHWLSRFVQTGCRFARS